MYLENRLARIVDRLKAQQPIPLRLKLWNGRTFDLGPQPRVSVAFPRASALRYFVWPDLAKLGEAYVEGRIQVEGSLKDVFEVGEQYARKAASASKIAGIRHAVSHSRLRDKKAIQYHYDVSNDFYSLWLDRQMVYSCAYFKTGDEDIDTAQEQKLDHICRKLRLRPGDKLLDIGCGWGGLVRWATKHYGVDATGITLSRNQHALASARIRVDGLENRCRVLLQDYRDVPGEGVYDKISSVGMFEHVGLKNLPLYFGVIHRLLKDGGIVMNHGITSVDPDSRSVGLGAGDFVEKYVFPHGELPHVSLALREMSSAGLEVMDIETLRLHYAKTLWHWSERLEANLERAREYAGDKRLRIWRAYLAGCAHAFLQFPSPGFDVLEIEHFDSRGTPRRN